MLLMTKNRKPTNHLRKGNTMANRSKKIGVYVRWGSTCEQYPTPQDADYYEFNTRAELNAFLLGANAAEGCDGFEALTPEEMARQPAEWDWRAVDGEEPESDEDD